MLIAAIIWRIFIFNGELFFIFTIKTQWQSSSRHKYENVLIAAIIRRIYYFQWRAFFFFYSIDHEYFGNIFFHLNANVYTTESKMLFFVYIYLSMELNRLEENIDKVIRTFFKICLVLYDIKTKYLFLASKW